VLINVLVDGWRVLLGESCSAHCRYYAPTSRASTTADTRSALSAIWHWGRIDGRQFLRSLVSATVPGYQEIPDTPGQPYRSGCHYVRHQVVVEPTQFAM